MRMRTSPSGVAAAAAARVAEEADERIRLVRARAEAAEAWRRRPETDRCLRGGETEGPRSSSTVGEDDVDTEGGEEEEEEEEEECNLAGTEEE